MLGLVVSGLLRSRVGSCDLARRLLSCGIREIPSEVVEEHKQRVGAQARAAGDTASHWWALRWEGRGRSWPEIGDIPLAIEERVEQALQIPGTVAWIEAFGPDPLVWIERKRWFREPEEVCIGGWKTRNPLIDNA